MQLAGGYEETPSTNFEAHKLRPHLAKQKEKLGEKPCIDDEAMKSKPNSPKI